MDGCSTFHTAPQMRSSSKPELGFKSLSVIFASFVALVLPSALFADARNNSNKPVAAAVTSQEWQTAQKTELAATMQVTFPTIMYDKYENVFSDVLTKLPIYFSNLKLNTIGRGMHSTLTYLDGLTLEGAKDAIKFFKTCDYATLEKYDLLRPVRVLDAENPEFVVIGTESRFVGLKPHQEFIDWQLRFYQLLADKAPSILEKHKNHRDRGENAISAEAVHISLVQFGSKVNVPLTDLEVAKVIAKIKTLFHESVAQFKAKHGGSLPEILFSLRTHPIELVTAPVSIHSPPTPIVSLRVDANNVPTVSKIGRWSIEGITIDADDEISFKKTVEFYVDDLIAGSSAPYAAKAEDFEPWIAETVKYDAMPENEFKAKIRPQLKRTMDIAYKNLSKTKYAALVPSDNPTYQGQFYVAKLTHPKLAPHKGFEALITARQLRFTSTQDTSIGMGLYASYVREEIKNPGDMDMLVNSLVHVPENVSTIEAAEAFAVRAFARDTLGHLKKLVKEGKIAITELRLGSDATMGNATGDILDALEENPYLSEEDVMKGEFTDKKGRVWKLEELIGLGDFMKGKVDLFTEQQGRVDVSLQFLAAYEWNGAIYTFQRHGMKGIPPLVRTAVYDGAESYAIAASIARAYDYYSTQKGPIVARAIRDVVKTAFGHSEVGGKDTAPVVGEPLWNSKFIKKVYNFLILLQKSGLSLDEIFVEETKQLLAKEGLWQEGFTVKELVTRLVGAINQSQLKTLNTIKRNVIDFEEFAERKTGFTQKSWSERKAETRPLIDSINESINTGFLEVSPEFKNSFRNFSDTFAKTETMKNEQQALSYLKQERLFDMFKTFHTELTKLEGHLIAKTPSAVKITEFDKTFIRTLISYSPHFYHRYLSLRSQDADQKMNWNLKLMGIEPTKSNMRDMQTLSDGLHGMSRVEFGQLQRGLFVKLKPSCKALLTEKGAIDVDKNQ